MPTQCFMAESEEDRKRPDAMWFDPTKPEVVAMLIDDRPDLSMEYKRDWLGKRSPLAMRLPNGQAWCIDLVASNNRVGSGWTVIGNAPNITARPSIATSTYHGWLKNGVLSDDLEGRQYI